MSHIKTISNWNLTIFIAMNGENCAKGDTISFDYNGTRREGVIERIGHGDHIVITIASGDVVKNYMYGKMENVQVMA